MPAKPYRENITRAEAEDRREALASLLRAAGRAVDREGADDTLDDLGDALFKMQAAYGLADSAPRAKRLAAAERAPSAVGLVARGPPPNAAVCRSVAALRSGRVSFNVAVSGMARTPAGNGTGIIAGT